MRFGVFIRRCRVGMLPGRAAVASQPVGLSGVAVGSRLPLPSDGEPASGMRLGRPRVALARPPGGGRSRLAPGALAACRQSPFVYRLGTRPAMLIWSNQIYLYYSAIRRMMDILSDDAFI
ncbi:hypothetical protein FJT64_010011 [Amphibalanus amphitrite]|uniref:Uncharacterized protein n=1 Tax=Amphibalanus amphitrite TaxID=1232801 RepID=A0A6A4VKV4_AMPAM|nr:hypothetical protein FJT64_010011 [Amphibalanus amphitrite]